MTCLIDDLKNSDRLYMMKNLEPETVNLPGDDGVFKIQLDRLAPFLTRHDNTCLGVIKTNNLITLSICNDGDFKGQLDKIAPFLTGFPLEDNGFILAGDSIINILMGIDYISDFDYNLFPVFHNFKTIEQSIINLISHLENYLRISFRDKYSLKIIKTKQALTITSDNNIFKIQVICGIDIDFVLKPKVESMLNILYNVCKLDETFDLELNISINNIESKTTIPNKILDDNDSILNYVKLKKRKELSLEMCKYILDSFDIGARQIAWDGNNILMTKLGKFAIEYKSIIFDNKTYSTSTNYRIVKYQDRGFNLILPNTNNNLLRLLPFIYINKRHEFISLKLDFTHSIDYIEIKNYTTYDFNNVIINNFINFCNNKINNILLIYNKDLNNKPYCYTDKNSDQLYDIIIKYIKTELKQKKSTKLIKFFDKNILMNLTLENFDENLIKNILINKINEFNEFIKTTNFNLIYQANNFNDLFDKRGIELEEWYGKAYISND